MTSPKSRKPRTRYASLAAIEQRLAALEAQVSALRVELSTKADRPNILGPSPMMPIGDYRIGDEATHPQITVINGANRSMIEW